MEPDGPLAPEPGDALAQADAPGARALPLDGVTVVELGANLAGPFAGNILAHLGADVVKVERPQGDDARFWGPPFWNDTSPAYLAMNPNKRGITLDLKDPEARAWLVDFVATADVLVHNMRPGAMEALGLGPEPLLQRHPRLVYCAIQAFGRVGPLRLRPGFEPMVQAFAGLMSLNGDESSPPTRIGTSILDFGTGMWAALGALAGLFQRSRTGRGCVVDASLLETALGWLTGHFAAFRVSGEVPVRHRTGSPRVVPFQAFRTRSGELVIAAGNDRLFAKLADALGHPEWAGDPRYATNPARLQHRAELLARIEAITETWSRGELLDRLDAAGVPCAPIHTLPEVVAHPQVLATGMIQRVPGTDLELIGLPLTFDGVRPAIRSAPPALGEHNEAIGRGAPPAGPGQPPASEAQR